VKTSLCTVLTAVFLCGRAGADDLEFFPRSELSFDVEPKPSLPVHALREPRPSDSSIAEAPLPLPPLPAASSDSVGSVERRLHATSEVKPEVGGPVIRSVAHPGKAYTLQQPTRVPAAPPQMMAARPTLEPEQENIAAVIDVQEVTPEVREQLEGRVRCADPLMAVVRLDNSLRQRVAEAIGVEPSKLGNTLKWVFGKESNCSDGRTPPPLQKALDAGAREYLRRTETK
jgi:hypothetical protein